MHETASRPLLIPPFPLALAALLLAGTAARAVPPRPGDMPADRDVLGTAFVESWLAFRQELDTLAHLPVHPGLLDSWLRGAPRYLLRDAVDLAAEPRVVAAAALALAAGADDEDRALLESRERRSAGAPLADELRACRIRSGDAAALARTRAELEDPRFVVRERAAFILAAAGRKEGLAALRELVGAHPSESLLALRALGLFGTAADDRLLEEAARRLPESRAAVAARGEIALRRAFPHHHRALLFRDGASARLGATGGQYDIWLAALHRALEALAPSSAAVAGRIEAQRKEAAGEDREVARRNLAALIDFWQQVDARLAATGDRPPWPAGMDDAMALVRSRRRASETPASTAKRISAVIAACAWAGGVLGHKRATAGGSGVRALTPNGGRALDGNFATAFHLTRKGRLVLELPAGSSLARLEIAVGCRDRAGPRLRRILVTAHDGGTSRSFEVDLAGATRYFQTVPLDGKPVRRLEIGALEIDGDGPACIAGIRLP